MSRARPLRDEPQSGRYPTGGYQQRQPSLERGVADQRDLKNDEPGKSGLRKCVAHGIAPKWRKGTYKDLAAESPQQLQTIDLHWHDLRHEYASRLVERGVPLAQVRDLLGHASIVTTERYDNQRLEALQAAAARLEEGKTFSATSDVVKPEVAASR